MALVGPDAEHYDKRFTWLINGTAHEGAAVRRLPLGGRAGLVRATATTWSGATSPTTACCAGCRTATAASASSAPIPTTRNGNTRDREGRLVTCEHGARRVTRTEPDGSITVIADSYKGKRLNSPNDVVVKSDGTIWFTDPSYGIMSDYEGHKAEHGAGRLLRLPLRSEERQARRSSPTISTSRTASPSRPTSRCSTSPTSACAPRAGEAAPHPRLQGRQGQHAEGRQGRASSSSSGFPDGFRVDTDGNVWTSAGAGDRRASRRRATLLGRINFPQNVSNLDLRRAEAEPALRHLHPRALFGLRHRDRRAAAVTSGQIAPLEARGMPAGSLRAGTVRHSSQPERAVGVGERLLRARPTGYSRGASSSARMQPHRLAGARVS